MGWRFKRSVRIAKGVRLNISKSGIGISAGPKGLRVGVGPRGPYTSAGIPGTGLYSVAYTGRGGKAKGAAGASQAAPVSQPSAGGSAIGCGVALTIVGLLAVWGVPAFGAVLMAVGVVLVVIGACDPKREVARKAEEARAKVEAAGDLCDQQRYAEAIPLLEEAKQLVPDVSAIYYLLGHALSGAERFTEAVTWLEEAQERGATDTPLPVVLGYTYYKAGQIEKGMEMLQAIPDDHPLFVTAISLLAGMFEERGQCETAIEVLKRAPLQKRNLTEELLQVHYVLGSYYLRLGDKKSALRHFRRVYAHSMDYRDVKAQIEALSGKL